MSSSGQPTYRLPDHLIQRYRGRLRAHVESLRTARRALAAGELEAQAGIRERAHALRGSGGIYGFATVSEAAGRVEDCSDAALLAELDRLLECLSAAAAGYPAPEGQE